MQFFNHTKPKMIVASPGKVIRDKNDIYKEVVKDEEGNIIEEEHFPYYSTTIFVPDSFTEDEMYDLYVEEDETENDKNINRIRRDENFKIIQNETGNIYDEAIDVENVNFTYKETTEKIEELEQCNEKI